MLPTVSGQFRVATDPELRFAPNGTAVCKVRAVATKRQERNGEWSDVNTLWTWLTCFKQQAENMAESLTKGDLVVVTGQIELQEWENDKGKGSAVNILVSDIGPSLYRDAAKIQKVERSAPQTGGGSQSTPQNDPWAAPAGDEPPF